MIKELTKRLLIRLGLQHYLTNNYFFLRYLHRKKICLSIQKQKVCFSTTDAYSKRRFYYKNEHRGLDYEPVVMEILSMSAAHVKTFFDIGAHIGFFSCIAAKMLPKGQVHCFEIDEKCIPLIEKNVQLNNLSNVHIHATGISDHNGLVQIPLLRNPDPGLMLVNDKASHANIELTNAAVCMLDTFSHQHRLNPDFIKIDVEGAEAQAMNGMKKMLGTPHLQLLIEIHARKLGRLGAHFSQVINPLLSNGFMVYEIIGHRLQSWHLRALNTTSELRNNTMIYAVRKAHIPYYLRTHL